MIRHCGIYGNPHHSQKAAVVGDHWRFTILTPSLVRMEYSGDGEFEDHASQTVMNRNFPETYFSVRQDKSSLRIKTETLYLEYRYGAFSMQNLKIAVQMGTGRLVEWHFGDSCETLKGTARTLDGADGAIPLEDGVVSRNGFAVLDDSRTMLLGEDGWVMPRTLGRMDLYFFGYGHRYQECVQDFYRLCGSTPLLPKWALGNWWSRYHQYTEEEYKELMMRFEQEKIPFSVAVIDMDWHLVDIPERYGSGWTGYTWNHQLFPDPARFLKWLHDKGLRTALNVHPADGVRGHEALYQKMAEALGRDTESDQAIAFDAADPEFMSVYFDVLHHELEKDGVDFWWIDWQQGDKTRLEGLDPLWILNHYHYLDTMREGRDHLIFSRYAGPGSHRYPVGFSGDTIISWASLRFQPYFTATAGNVGYSWWSHDIGGHMLGYRDDELAVRWLQLGVFSPINRLHSSNNPFSGKEPWNYGKEAEEIMKAYLRLRHELIPYLNTMNHRTHAEGIPLIRPLYWMDPEQEEAYQYPNEYYFGSELLAVPVTAPTDPVTKLAAVKAWIPEGRWFDIQTGRVYEGSRELTLYRSLDQVPVFAKAGGILVRDCSGQEEERTLDVFPGAAGEFVLWENGEDGSESGVSTRLVYRQPELVIEPSVGALKQIFGKRRWIVNFRNITPGTAEVCADGVCVRTQELYDEKTRTFTVRIPDTAVSSQLTIQIKGEHNIVSVDCAKEAFQILNRAQIPYELKSKLQKMMEERDRFTVYRLQNLLEGGGVASALSELLSLEG